MTAAFGAGEGEEGAAAIREKGQILPLDSAEFRWPEEGMESQKNAHCHGKVAC